ncbi:MAG: hypothetical protein Q9227_007525 [Pyrenula ochraceoflavens]
MPAIREGSISPPPLAPTASTPGPRAVALHKIFETALSTTIRTHSYGNFAACFPTPARHCPAALEGVWRQLNAKLEDGCKAEFDAILSERDVVKGLNCWDEVVDTARRKKARAVDGEVLERAPHSLSTEELYNAYLHPHMQLATKTVQDRLRNTQDENTQLVEKLVEQRQEIARLTEGLEALVRDLEGSVEAMDEGEGRGVDGLRSEMWEIERETQNTTQT